MVEKKEKTIKTDENFFIEMSKIGLELETKGKLSYASWADVRDTLKRKYPKARKIWYTNDKGTLGFVDEFGAYAKVSIEIPELKVDNLENPTWLPIQDNKNDPIKIEAYKYTRRNKYKNKDEDIKVDALDSNWINKAYQRCTVKAIAELLGLGLYIYRGEDLPTNEEAKTPIANPETSKPVITQPEISLSQKQKDNFLNEEVANMPTPIQNEADDNQDADKLVREQGVDYCKKRMLELGMVTKEDGSVGLNVDDIKKIGGELLTKRAVDNTDENYVYVKNTILIPYINELSKASLNPKK